MYFRQKLQLFITFLAWFVSTTCHAQIIIPAAPKLDANSYVLMDFDSASVLVEKNPDSKLAPASLTKIMTAYVAFHELSSANLNLSDKVTISEKAWRTGGSRMYIEVESQVLIEELLKGMIVQSGNDASVAIAEHIAGDEATFAQLMNQHALQISMENTNFTNSTGLPDVNHYTTARDLALLTRAMISKFPEYYKWHALKEFSFNKIKQYNRNKLLWRDESVDGVKTGHTEEAGYCLVTSAKRGTMRLISVVMGTESMNARTNANQGLLNFGFRFYETHKLYSSHEALTETKIRRGKVDNLQLGLAQDLYVTIPRRHYKDLKATMEIDNHITAPVALGDTVGTVNVMLATDTVIRKPLVALQSIPEGNLFKQLYDEALKLIE